ncbi:MAG: metal-dependent hydrolase [Thermoactinomycetaceae bacterium]|nr:metal-dependent hydrolase [Thermoactinomycetaceae bacterium]
MLAKLLRGWLMVAVLGMLPAFGAEAGDAAPPKGRAVKVLTYNIAHGVGHDGRLDLDRIAGVIRRSGADVVALQEVDKHWDARSDFVDQAAALGEKLNMRVRFAPIYSLDPPEPGKPRREYGLAILSRYPITHFKNHELSRISSVEPEKGVQKLPGFPEAVINLHGRKIHLFNTHLSWLDPELRRLEAEEMLEIMGSARHPVVLAGDMNALPDAPEMERLRDVLTDTFEAAGKGDGHTFPVPDPVRRIDYIFASPEIRPLDSRVIEEEGSDHYGVLSTLWVGSSREGALPRSEPM